MPPENGADDLAGDVKARLIGVALVFAGAVIGLATAVAEGRGLPTDWVIVDYEVNWLEFGFVRRGLVGTIAHPFLRVADHATVARVGFVLTMAGFLWLVARRLGDLPPANRERLGALLLATPFVVAHAFYELGRSDLLGLVLLLLGLGAVRAGRAGPAVAVVVLGLLNHESFLLHGVTAMLVLAWLLHRQWRPVAQLAIPAGLVFGALAVWGDFEAGATAFDRRVLTAVPDYKPGVDRASPYTSSALEEVQRSLTFMADPTVAPQVLAGVLVVLALGYVLVRHVRLSIWVLAPAATLSLTVVGIDHARWASLSVASMLLLALHLPGAQRTAWVPATPRRTWAERGLLAMLLLGPVGDVRLFPLITNVLLD